MPDRLKSFARRATHPLARRIGRDQFGMRGFQLFEAVHHAVKGGVGNLRVVENVIAVFVVPQLLAELLDLVFHTGSGGFGHETLGRTDSWNSTHII